jgi:hypothetical protein
MSEATLASVFGWSWHAVEGAFERTGSGLGDVVGDINDEDFGDDCIAVSENLSLECEGAALMGAIRPMVTVVTDPGFFAGANDIVGIGGGMRGCAGDKDGEMGAVMVARVPWWNDQGPEGNSDAEVALIEILVRGRLFDFGKEMIFVGKADPTAVGAEDVEMRTAAQSAWGERLDQIASIEVDGRGGLCGVDDDAASVPGRVGPIARGIFWTMDEHGFEFGGAGRDDTASCAARGAIEDAGFAG